MGSFTFKWEHPAEEVYVTGTFDGWTKSVKLEKEGDVFQKSVELKDASQKIYYKIKTTGPDLPKMIANNVNKTALHPTGVTPHLEHTELEQELHDKAHIDYDRVAIIPNPSVAALYEDALVYETGTAITSSGALTAYSGAKTGRSPLDKRIVEEPSSKDNIW
ncbi:hypothetical protein G7Z17_g6671 [Cylindrodendrum hubeiense]|uniref:Phosphoenolpyruvate carboxykinase (ATP) n=1 Tax=Cylindrodendrum hubeiense TaxID=595255 RepID=A0A9P5H6W3_9HYPO|nr:hypothetical protein G7Z17_g6671 [Cylindrodendrum hubeiense]